MKLARRALPLAALLALLTACGGGDAPVVSESPPTAAPATPTTPPATPADPLPISAPAMPAGLAMTYDVKTFKLAWDAVTAPAGGGGVTYRLFEDPDGAGPEPGTQIGGTLAVPAHDHVVTGLLHTRLNARYAVQACNSAGCSALTAAIAPDLTRAIGYFKASNTRAGDVFGSAVALSADGRTLAVGAPGESSAATGTHTVAPSDVGAPSSGAVHVFVRTGSVWTQQAYVKASNTGDADAFGTAVALSADGSTLAVGASREDSDATGAHAVTPGDGAGMSNSGAVYVYTRTAGAWSQQAYVKASNTGPDDRFGTAVALSGDGDTLAVGAPWEDSAARGTHAAPPGDGVGTLDSGAVYVYARAGASWTPQAYVKASISNAAANFGQSVALSGDGGTLVVGAPWEEARLYTRTGAAYVYTRAAGTWRQEALVMASNADDDDRFGTSVALSADGNTLAVGAYEESSASSGVNGVGTDNSTTGAGAVYVYVRAGGIWTGEAYVKSSNPGFSHGFGRALALSPDGATLAAGAIYEDSNATGIGGNQSNHSAYFAGAAYVYTRTAGLWAQTAYLKASNSSASAAFGWAVALSGEGTLAVGAYQESGGATGVNGNQRDNSASKAGAVYVY